MRSSSVTKKVATITAAAFILLALTTMAVMTTFVTADAGSSSSVTQSVTQSSNDGTSSSSVTQSSNDGTSSVRVTQDNDEGLEVNCEGDVNCEIIGEDTVVATSEDGDSTTALTTTTTDTTTATINQSDVLNGLSNDFDSAVDDEQDDLGDRIEGMVDRLLDDVSASLTNWRMWLFT